MAVVLSALARFRSLAVLALVLTLSVSVKAQEAPIQLDAAGMRQLALTAMQAGRPEVVLRLTQALLQRDPNDTMALVLRSRTMRDLGRYDEARKLAARAWPLAQTSGQRHTVALIKAQALSSSGRRGQAQLWLRRAVHEAPTPAARARAAQDFAYVRSRNPLSVQLGFSAAPSNNVNSGSQHRLMGLDEFLPGIPGADLILTDRPVDMTALPGWVVQGNLQMRYRLNKGIYGKTYLRAGADWRTAFLGPQAQARIDAYLADNPGSAVNTDFSQGGVEIGLAQRYERQNWAVSGGVTGSHRWQSGASAYSGLRFDLGAEYRVSPRSLIHGGLSHETRWSAATGDVNSQIVAFQLGGVQALQNGDRLRAVVGLRATQASQVRNTNLASSLRLVWEKSEPIAGIGLDFGLSAEHRSYPHDTVGREDLSLSADVTLRLTKIEYMGFSPTVTFRAARNMSSARMFDGDELGVSLGWRSNF